MLVKLKYIKETNNYVYYETLDTDFRFPYKLIMKVWIPRRELIDGGGIPEQIEFEFGSGDITVATEETGSNGDGSWCPRPGTKFDDTPIPEPDYSQFSKPRPVVKDDDVPF